MSFPVHLYVYDLSFGQAARLSMSLTGRQINGIWHTSVVVFGQEIFYGQGIAITLPGKSHYGKPLQVIEMGNTEVDQETFEGYLEIIHERFTADNYHLIEFNCNTFSDECIQFLTGNRIPDHITSLPADFLSTPLGEMLRPTIDAMFRRGAPSATSATSPEAVRVSSGLSAPDDLLRSMATLALPSGSPSGPPTTPPTSNDTAHVTICSDLATFQSILTRKRGVVAFFTSANCRPCHVVEPSFEDLAKNKRDVAFVKVDVLRGTAIASRFGVRATPTFIFFLDGNKIHELRGANVPELRAQVDKLIYTIVPPHPHTSLSLPAVESMERQPILFTRIPDLDKLLAKLSESIDLVPSWTSVVSQAQVKQVLSKTVVPFLKAPSGSLPSSQPATMSFDFWPTLTESLVSNLAVDKLFPVVDIWRIALLNPRFSGWSATKKVPRRLVELLLCKALESEVSRNYVLTLLQMFSNAFSDPKLAIEVVTQLVKLNPLLALTLQHEDQAVRQAAASLAYNIAAYLQNQRLKQMRSSDDGVGPEGDEDSEVEMICAVLEAIKQESKSEETVHRLIASLALLLRFTPFVEQVVSLVTVLDARTMLKEKLKDELLIKRPEVRNLVTEVAENLCH